MQTRKSEEWRDHCTNQGWSEQALYPMNRTQTLDGRADTDAWSRESSNQRAVWLFEPSGKGAMRWRSGTVLSTWTNAHTARHLNTWAGSHESRTREIDDRDPISMPSCGVGAEPPTRLSHSERQWDFTSSRAYDSHREEVWTKVWETCVWDQTWDATIFKQPVATSVVRQFWTARASSESNPRDQTGEEWKRKRDDSSLVWSVTAQRNA